MTEMSRNPEAVAEAIRKAQRIAVCSHVNPDGDTLGCATAMRLALMISAVTLGALFAETVKQIDSSKAA